MKRNIFAQFFLAAVVIAFGFSSVAKAAEDGGAAWVKAMEAHAGLKDLAPIAGCMFTLDEYTVADGTFTSQTDIARQSIMDFITQLWEASKRVSKSGISGVETQEKKTEVQRQIEDIAQVDINQIRQIRWRYDYDAGSGSKIRGSLKRMIITIDDSRNVSFQIAQQR